MNINHYTFGVILVSQKNLEGDRMNYKTPLKAYDLLWRGLVGNPAEDDDLVKGEQEAGESYFGGRRKGKRSRGAEHMTIAFGILERSGEMVH